MPPTSAGVPVLTDEEFKRVGSFIEREFGIKMPAGKKALIQSRLHKRVLVHSMKSYGDYFDFVVDDPAGRDEFLVFMDLVSTHETNFFREPDHFQHLRGILPVLHERRQGRGLRVLSAACSTGEEAFTMAMVADQALAASEGGAAPFLVEGFDLSPRVVAIARRAVYSEQRVSKIPEELKRRYLMRSRDRAAPLFRMVPELRAMTSFHTGNLLDDMGLEEHRYDVIFCRNVFIYFDKSTQEYAISMLAERLEPDGYLYVGHSESLSGIDLPLKAVSHAVFQPR